MSILYCSYSQVPSKTANSLAVMKMSHALSLLKPFRLLAVNGDRHIEHEEIWSYYGVGRFPMQLVPRQVLLFNDLPLACLSALYARLLRPKACYVRSIAAATLLAKLGYPVIFELHQIEQNHPRFDAYFRNSLRELLISPQQSKVICISEYLKQECLRFGFADRQLIVLPSGCDTPCEAGAGERHEARRKLGVDLAKPLIAYIGSLQHGKGLATMIRVMRMRPDYRFLIVGSAEEQLREKLHKIGERFPDNLIYRPHMPPGSVRELLIAADVCLMPYSEHTALKFHSPLKLFESFSSGVPVIISNVLGYKEIVQHRYNGMFAQPDNPSSFAEAIDEIVSNPELGKDLSRSALKTAGLYTWQQRAQKIIDLVYG